MTIAEPPQAMDPVDEVRHNRVLFGFFGSWFVVMGGLVAWNLAAVAPGWAAYGVFIAGIGLFLGFRPRWVRLTATGLEVQGYFRRRSYLWAEISSVYMQSSPPMRVLVIRREGGRPIPLGGFSTLRRPPTDLDRFAAECNELAHGGPPPTVPMPLWTKALLGAVVAGELALLIGSIAN